MSHDHYSDSAIIALTEGIGAEFGRATRRSFYVQRDRLRQNPRFQNQDREKQQSLIDLLALAALFQTVIVPIQCTGSFIQVLHKAEAMELRVGRDRLNASWSQKANGVSEGFRFLLDRLEITSQLLEYSTLDIFVKNAVRYFKLRDGKKLD